MKVGPGFRVLSPAVKRRSRKLGVNEIYGSEGEGGTAEESVGEQNMIELEGESYKKVSHSEADTKCETHKSVER